MQKIILYNFLLVGVLLLINGCHSEKNNALNELFTKSIKTTTEAIKQETLEIVAEMEENARIRTQYIPVVQKAQKLLALNDSVLLEIEKTQELRRLIDGELLLQNLKQNYITEILSIWEKGGIKGTIFADSKKIEKSKYKLQKEMEVLFDSQKLKNKTSSFNSSLLAELENETIRLEHTAIFFLASQLSYHFSYYSPSINMFALSSSPVVLLGEKYQSEISFTNNNPRQNPLINSVYINDSLVMPHSSRHTYQKKLTSSGKKETKVQLTLTTKQGDSLSISKTFNYYVNNN